MQKGQSAQQMIRTAIHVGKGTSAFPSSTGKDAQRQSSQKCKLKPQHHALEQRKLKRRTPPNIVNMEKMKTSTTLQTLRQLITKLNVQLHDPAVALTDIYQEK